jgi:hypothetical protein
MHLRDERAALREDAATLLYELGGTADEVGVSLGALGVRMRPSEGSDSPAARYLQAVVGADTRVKQVTVTKGWLKIQTHRKGWARIRLRLPYPVRQFVTSLDEARLGEATEIRALGEEGWPSDSPRFRPPPW